jgi:tRNA (cmo5U34)-methyltransferase
VHNLADPGRIRKLSAEIYDVVADGGFFMNFDYVRAPSPRVRELVNWASGDPEAGYLSRSTGGQASGSLDEQLGWLREAGFAPVDCFWKEFQATLFGGFKGSSPLPARG